MVSGTANIGGSEAVSLLGAVIEGHKDEFPAAAAPALFAPNALGFYDFAGNVSGVGQRPLPVIRGLERRSRIRSAPTTARITRIRGSNWRTVSTGELRFPWREGAVVASDVIGFRVARYVAPE